ncbi:hypothetical protein J3458_009072 [Metarhizium acridum]|uniref:uncharacterized protein n=1 Tax=Metarhizium acridum TaxID=92637 RepID=UPI001C6C7973|nr:hypothetical protein J3458_009072 [Metarhizium acridum]
MRSANILSWEKLSGPIPKLSAPSIVTNFGALQEPYDTMTGAELYVPGNIWMLLDALQYHCMFCFARQTRATQKLNVLSLSGTNSKCSHRVMVVRLNTNTQDKVSWQ